MSGIAESGDLQTAASRLPAAGTRHPSAAASWRVLYLAISVVFIGLLVGGAFFYQAEATSAHRKVHDRLDIVSALKVEQIVQWRRELLGNAEDLASQPHLVAAVERWLRQPATPDLATITTSLSILKGRADLNDAMIVDAGGTLRLNLIGHSNILDGALVELSVFSTARFSARETVNKTHRIPATMYLFKVFPPVCSHCRSQSALSELVRETSRTTACGSQCFWFLCLGASASCLIAVCQDRPGVTTYYRRGRLSSGSCAFCELFPLCADGLWLSVQLAHDGFPAFNSSTRSRDSSDKGVQ